MFDRPHPPLNDREEQRRAHEAQSAAIDLIGELLLSDPTKPESRKIGIRIMLETKKLTDKITKAFLAFAEPAETAEKCEALYPERKEVFEYIRLVSAGIDTFLAAHPAPAKEPGANQDHQI